MLLNGSLLKRADPTRGRFRSLLLKAVKNFLSDARDKVRAQKRGGGIQFVKWDEWMSEAPSQLAVSAGRSADWSAEKIFDVRWAATVVEQALSRLAQECESRGGRRAFDELSCCLTGERVDQSYAQFSKVLGVPETSIKRLIHELRKRYRLLLREEVSRTVETSEGVDEELRYLCAVLAEAG